MTLIVTNFNTQTSSYLLHISSFSYKKKRILRLNRSLKYNRIGNVQQVTGIIKNKTRKCTYFTHFKAKETEDILKLPL